MVHLCVSPEGSPYTGYMEGFTTTLSCNRQWTGMFTCCGCNALCPRHVAIGRWPPNTTHSMLRAKTNAIKTGGEEGSYRFLTISLIRTQIWLQGQGRFGCMSKFILKNRYVHATFLYGVGKIGVGGLRIVRL